MPDHPDADLKEEVERYGDEDECHNIRWGDDCRSQHDDNECMFAVFGKHLGIDNTQLAEEKSNDGQLEHHAHDKCQRNEGADIRIQCDVAYHIGGDTIGSQKSEGYREEHEVAHQHPQNEEQINNNCYLN